MSDRAADETYMREAYLLAERGRYSTPPNPAVGCVIVKDGRVVGRGFHVRAGEAHAEVVALVDAGAAASSATAYVTLEPCNHQGRTGPCTQALIAAGISRVVYAEPDPNPSVAGQGARRLADAGLEVDHLRGIAAPGGLNRGYFHRQRNGRPFVRVKIAMSLDGAMAMASGESQWITGPPARERVQALRAESGAVLTGIGTVLSDDPSLTVRHRAFDTRGRQPIRVVLDSSLRTPLDAALLGLPGDTHLFTASDDTARRDALEAAGARISGIDRGDDGLSLSHTLERLAALDVNEVLVEAGPTLAGRFLAARLYDELVVFIAPKILGRQARRAFDCESPALLADCMQLEITGHERVGDDMVLVCLPRKSN